MVPGSICTHIMRVDLGRGPRIRQGGEKVVEERRGGFELVDFLPQTSERELFLTLSHLCLLLCQL